MKKVFTLMMAFAMMLALSVPAFAAEATVNEVSTDKTGQMTATLTQDQSYTVTIPDTITAAKQDATPTAVSISASNVFIDANQTLKVTVASGKGWKLKDEKGGEFGYALKVGESVSALADNGEVLSVGAGTQTGSASLTAQLTEEVTKSGTFTDTLTFTVNVATN